MSRETQANTDLNIEGKLSQKFQLTLPGIRDKMVSVEYTSDLGWSGRQGFVRPAVIMDGNERLPVQIKTFYRNTADDRGEPFSQDPQKEVEGSYKALLFLKEKGFKTLPFFGVLTDNEGQKLLVMSDLRNEETHEVYDEKDIHRGRDAIQMINGKEYKINARQVIENLANIEDVMLDFLRTNLLSLAFQINLGFGVAHMVVRNPNTNKGEAIIADVGEIDYLKSKYREAVPFEELLNIPLREILDNFTAMLKNDHPKVNSTQLFETYLSTQDVKREFQDLFYKAAIGLSLLAWMGGWGGDAEWARERFVQNNFSEHFMKVKWNLHQESESFLENAGYPLWNITPQAHDKFIAGQTEEDLMAGIDFAYLAVLDRRISHLMAVREDVDAQKIPSTDTSPMRLSEGFPRMGFFDNYDETKGKTYTVKITSRPYGPNSDEIEAAIELDWKMAYLVKTSGGTRLSFFQPSQVKGLSINGKSIADFDARKIEISSLTKNPKIGSFATYYYVDSSSDTTIQICRVNIENEKDLKKVKSLLRKNSH